MVPDKISEILHGTTPKNSGLDEGMTEEDARHKTLLLLAYIAEKLENIDERIEAFMARGSKV